MDVSESMKVGEMEIHHFSHPQHPLTLFISDQVTETYYCPGCGQSIDDGSRYGCKECKYYLHKECAELPLEITHPYDRKHRLTLLPNPPSHPENCTCYLCKIQWKGFVYSCSLCNIHLTSEDVFEPNPRTITNASHEHPWTLLSRHMPFICDFCGTSGDHTPYLCTTCDILVHKKCISMPCKIMITRHRHVISHSFSLQEDHIEDWMCRICHEEVIARYGSYCCARLNCNYIAHVHCATNKNIWDGEIIPDDYDESSMEELLRPSNLITVVSEQMGEEEQMVAIEIKHAFHDHNLRLISSDEIKDDDIQCDGCMRPISTPFYSCEQCNFFLHKDCAELPKGKRHPFHKHLLTLSSMRNVCSACQHGFDGFSYSCNHKDCGGKYFNYDIRCIELSDTLKHPSHEHSLFLVHSHPKKCSGCLRKLYPRDMAYRCTKRCDFALDITCATIPLEAHYKYDRHPLSLTYSDDSSPSQHYCDLCENERNHKNWFYHCTDCDNALHVRCALADPQFLKLGSIIIDNEFAQSHRHPLRVVKNIWNCPPCKVCSNLCNGVALECKESECNFTAHWLCCLFLGKPI